MKSAVVTVAAIFAIAALAEGASINLREKRHHQFPLAQDQIDPGFGHNVHRPQEVLDPGFGEGWHDQFRPDGPHRPGIHGHPGGSEANSESQAFAGSHGDGGFGSQAGSNSHSNGFGGGFGSSSNAGSSAGASGALTKASSESESFSGGNGSFSFSSSSASSSSGPNFHPHFEK